MEIHYKIYYKLKILYYNIKYTIINFIKYFKIVSEMRPWDSIYIYKMMSFQLKILCNFIEKYGDEIDETKLPKIKKMKRLIELLDNIENNNFIELKNNEWNEIIEIFKNSRNWWD